MSLLFGALFSITTFRRKLWLRIMDAEESFWVRFGLPKGGSFRRFGESRFFAISMAFFAVALLILAALLAGLYFRYRKYAD